MSCVQGRKANKKVFEEKKGPEVEELPLPPLVAGGWQIVGERGRGRDSKEKGKEKEEQR